MHRVFTFFAVGLRHIKGRRKFFYSGRLSKNGGHNDWPTTKRSKKKLWLRRPKLVPKKVKAGPNVVFNFRFSGRKSQSQNKN